LHLHAEPSKPLPWQGALRLVLFLALGVLLLAGLFVHQWLLVAALVATGLAFSARVDMVEARAARARRPGARSSADGGTFPGVQSVDPRVEATRPVVFDGGSAEHRRWLFPAREERRHSARAE